MNIYALDLMLKSIGNYKTESALNGKEALK
jgi:hypothetical protein